MPSPLQPTRRQVVTGSLALSGSIALAGCASGPSASTSTDAPPGTEAATATRNGARTTTRDDASLPTIHRPTPATSRPTGPKPYPSPPEELSAAAAGEVAYAYEGAWIANRLSGEPCVESYTLAPTVTDPEREVVERGRSAILVRIRHPYAFSAQRADGQLHADLASAARYYVSTGAVVRVRGDDINAPCD